MDIKTITRGVKRFGKRLWNEHGEEIIVAGLYAGVMASVAYAGSLMGRAKGFGRGYDACMNNIEQCLTKAAYEKKPHVFGIPGENGDVPAIIVPVGTPDPKEWDRFLIARNTFATEDQLPLNEIFTEKVLTQLGEKATGEFMSGKPAYIDVGMFV